MANSIYRIFDRFGRNQLEAALSGKEFWSPGESSACPLSYALGVDISEDYNELYDTLKKVFIKYSTDDFNEMTDEALTFIVYYDDKATGTSKTLNKMNLRVVKAIKYRLKKLSSGN